MITKTEAMKKAEDNGHVMGEWCTSESIKRQFAVCENCGATVGLLEGDIEVTGTALSTQCKRAR